MVEFVAHDLSLDLVEMETRSWKKAGLLVRERMQVHTAISATLYSYSDSLSDVQSLPLPNACVRPQPAVPLLRCPEPILLSVSLSLRSF